MCEVAHMYEKDGACVTTAEIASVILKKVSNPVHGIGWYKA